MSHPVIAIGLDAAEPAVVERWIAEGYLPNLASLRQQGSYGRLRNTVNYAGQPTKFSVTEPLWVMFSTGCLPEKTGFWDTVRYDGDTYGTVCDKITGGYDYREYAPFYALGDRYRVAAFDIPVSALSDEVNGLQILGWGGHFPFTPSHSSPPNLLPELVAQYGPNPVLHNDHGYWWSPQYRQWLEGALETSISRRVAMCHDLLQRDDWDLFITVFGDTHSAGHDFLHHSNAQHPLHEHFHQPGEADPMLRAYQQVDKAVGEILAAAPEDAYVVCFSLHGMDCNHQDTLSMMFLGEVLYRFNFPGQVALAPGDAETPAPPMITKPLRGSWLGELWRKVWDPNPIKQLLSTWLPGRFLRFDKGDLACPYTMTDNLNFMPVLWYRKLWPQMRAFALPAFSDGHIRINLKGREPQGIVDPADYDALCEELTAMLHQLKNGRTGEPLVREVVRTRRSPAEDGPEYLDADLVVVWHEQVVDVLDSPELGRIGPVTLFRSGGHRPEGFVTIKGPGIEANGELPVGHAVDLAPTILELMDAPIPEHLDGQSLLSQRARHMAV